MADIAQLGIAVDSSQADKGAASLQRLSGAARMAEQATNGVASGSRAAAQANAVVAGSADVATASLTRQAGAARQAAVAVNDNVRRMGGSFSGLAAQVQDIGVTAAMGMNPLIIGLQQGTQIAGQMEMAMQNGGSAASIFGQALTSLLSPVSLLSIAMTILLAAGLQMVDWPAAAAWALNMMADSLEVIAPYATMAAAGLALLYAPAIIGGIVSVIALLARMTVAALTAAASLALANPAAAFVLSVTAMVAAANIFRDELTQIFGFDIVGAAKDGVNGIIGAFLGAYDGIVATWDQLPAAMADLGVRAMNAMNVAIVEGINNAIAKVKDFLLWLSPAAQIAKLAGYDVGAMIDIPKFTPTEIANPNAGAASMVGGSVSDAIASRQGVDYVGSMTGAITRGASAASGKLKELAAGLTEVDEKSKKGRGGGGKTDAEHYQDIVDGANRRIATLQAEQDALGLTEFAAAKLRYETDLLNEAQQKGISLSEAQKVALSGLAGTMAAIELATKRAKEAMEFGKDVVKGFVSDLRSGLEEGKSLWESFASAARNAIDKVVDKLLNNLIDALFQVNSASMGVGGAGGGGFLGGILGSIGKIFGFASGGYTGNGAVNAAAGVVHGQEYVFSAAATRKIGVGNLDRMHRSAKGYANGGFVMPAATNNNGGGDVQVHVTVGWSRTADGNLKPFVENVSQGVVKKATPQIVGASVSQANQNVMPTVSRHQNDVAGGEWRLG